jgi:D-alanyl-D-alanine dipeptidase
MKRYNFITGIIAIMCPSSTITTPPPFTTSKDASRLVNIQTINSTIKTNILYACPHNFTGKTIYPPSAACYLLKNVAEQLNAVQHDLKNKGLGLLVTDAFRPLSAQQALWEACPDERYVAHPSKGGRHTRGTTIDVTLIQLSNGIELDMGTEVDEMKPEAAYTCPTISDEAKKNRALLRNAMKDHGFEPIQNEWWHFDYKGWQSQPVLDVDFDTLRQ